MCGMSCSVRVIVAEYEGVEASPAEAITRPGVIAVIPATTRRSVLRLESSRCMTCKLRAGSYPAQHFLEHVLTNARIRRTHTGFGALNEARERDPSVPR